MTQITDIPQFQPRSEWYEGWSFGVDTLVQVEARIAGTAADRAVNAFLESLTHDTDADRVDGVRLHYWGGFTVESAASIDENGWRLVLASAGEDGFDSLVSAADDLVDKLRATPGEVRLVWHELPVTRAPGAEPQDD